jgi:hypothetical protein
MWEKLQRKRGAAQKEHRQINHLSNDLALLGRVDDRRHNHPHRAKSHSAQTHENKEIPQSCWERHFHPEMCQRHRDHD